MGCKLGLSKKALGLFPTRGNVREIFLNFAKFRKAFPAVALRAPQAAHLCDTRYFFDAHVAGKNILFKKYRSKLDLDLHAGGKLKSHQGLDGLLGGGDDVDEALVSPETLASVLFAVSTIFSAVWSMS